MTCRPTISPAIRQSADGPPPSVSYRKLDFNGLVQFRRYLENACRAMYRRDSVRAKNEILNAQSLFRRFDANGIALDPSQLSMKNFADSAATIELLLEQFWKQVIDSSVAIPAGQPIEVAGYTIGFVDGTKEFVILRIDGTNVKFDYEFLPPGIAMALADQGAVDDVPTYRMQKAACYAIHKHVDPNYRQRALAFANQAAADGHDPMPVRQFVDFELANVGVPAAQAAPPSVGELRERLSEHITTLGIDDFERMRPDQAGEAIESAMEAALQDEDDLRRALSFEVAYKLATKAGDIRVANDVLDEYALWFKIDYPKRTRQALI